MTKKDAINEINETQEFYINKLSDIITGVDNRFDNFKEIDFSSPTGTGKTVMVAKLINKLPDYFFVITSLSKGQLKKQIENKIKSYCKLDNYVIYGTNDYTANSILKENDVLKILPKEKRIIWIRDEGHIATNRWQEILRKRSYYIVNFSATNKGNNGIQCNFAHTMMLRTVSQINGGPEEALDKLIEIKNIHAKVNGYNPCALFRVIYNDNLERVINECKKRNLSYINITNEEYDMSDICKDDNKYDVIINKFKITEGIDLKRCHVIFMDSRPSNESTVIQVIGRARRNALFWRDDINILSNENRELLEQTRKCYVYYNVAQTEVSQNDSGEFLYSLCDTISVEALKPNIKISVKNGQLNNGLYILELYGKSGSYYISYDVNLDSNIISNDEFYREESIEYNPYVIDLKNYDYNIQKIYLKPDFVKYFIKKNNRFINDKCKFSFARIKLFCLKNNISFNSQYWEEYLNMDDKRNFVDQEKWNQFCHDAEVKNVIEQVYSENFYASFNNEEFAKIKQFSEIEYDKECFGKKNIFVEKCGGVYLNDELDPFIEKIQYFKTDFYEEIEKKLSKFNNIRQISCNRFWYSPHPFTKFLNDKDIKDLESIKTKVFTYKGKTLFGCSIEYWKNMLLHISNFSEIDTYDSQILSFRDINLNCKFNLNDKKVKQYSCGIYELKTSFANNNIKISKINCQTRLLENVYHVNFYVFKTDFENRYIPYSKIINDYEIAVIGPDIMKYVNHRYIEDSTITSKITKFCKFNKFITNKYDAVLKECSKSYFKFQNDFGFDKKCNSCLGFCVEYFAKIKLFGDDFYKPFIEEACSEAKTKQISDIIRVRAAMIIYREEMKKCYGSMLSSIIPAIKISNLIKEYYTPFVEKVIELGNITAEFVLEKVYKGVIDSNTKFYDPNLSVNHITALCDFISKDTILDLKCTSSINEKHIKQVLSYYYLSRKRSDLNIKKLIVFDAPTQRFVEINMEEYDKASSL